MQTKRNLIILTLALLSITIAAADADFFKKKLSRSYGAHDLNGTLLLNVFEEVYMEGRLVSLPLLVSSNGVYVDTYSEVLGPTPYVLDGNGKAIISLTPGEHSLNLVLYTGKERVFVSQNYTFNISSGTETDLSLKLTPREVTIYAEVDVGYGNAVYITGVGESLGSWHNVLKMTPFKDNIGRQQWGFSAKMPRGIEFKLLKNKWFDFDVMDIHAGGFEWEQGPNHSAVNVDMDSNEVSPKFDGFSQAMVA